MIVEASVPPTIFREQLIATMAPENAMSAIRAAPFDALGPLLKTLLETAPPAN
jgi:hypothetical protein